MENVCAFALVFPLFFSVVNLIEFMRLQIVFARSHAINYSRVSQT